MLTVLLDTTDVRGRPHRPVGARRDDIQGLRAVGALLIATFHIWIGRVSGGVDVFFVISGFLLVGSLDRELRTGADCRARLRLSTG